MITAEDFTKAADEKMPSDPGLYVCLIQAKDSEKVAYVFGNFSTETGPDVFVVNRKSQLPAEVIAWVQIKPAKEVVKELNKNISDATDHY